jgi:hypothetical protein
MENNVSKTLRVISFNRKTNMIPFGCQIYRSCTNSTVSAIDMGIILDAKLHWGRKEQARSTTGRNGNIDSPNWNLGTGQKV